MKKTHPMGLFRDYLPRKISNASRTLQMERDNTIFIKKKISWWQVLPLHPPPRVESRGIIGKIKKSKNL
jgi:hypothetical protein